MNHFYHERSMERFRESSLFHQRCPWEDELIQGHLAYSPLKFFFVTQMLAPDRRSEKQNQRRFVFQLWGALKCFWLTLRFCLKKEGGGGVKPQHKITNRTGQKTVNLNAQNSLKHKVSNNLSSSFWCPDFWGGRGGRSWLGQNPNFNR